MEIVAFDEDDKADGSGKAKITWISKNLLKTTHNMNSTNTSAGGWESSEMRAYLKNTIKPLIPETVRNAIVPVTKIQSTVTGGTKVVDGQTTTDDVWIPSNHEVGFGTSCETTGATYTKFSANADRIKKKDGTAKIWWLRSANNSTFWNRVTASGSSSTALASTATSVALGFCT